MRFPRFQYSLKWLLGAIMLVAILMAAVRWREREQRLRVMAQTRLAAALRTWQLTWRACGGGDVPCDEVYDASIAVMKAQSDLDRVAAARDHLSRMRVLAYYYGPKGSGEMASELDSAKVECWVREAEYWLAIEE